MAIEVEKARGFSPREYEQTQPMPELGRASLPQDVRQIDHEIESLAQVGAALDDATRELMKRLEPVLRDVEPSETEGSPAMPLVPLADSIRVQRYGLEMSLARLVSILGRLEV
jgi:hypothetical protein